MRVSINLAMSSEQKRNIVVFLCIITVAFSNLMSCGALSVEKFTILNGFNADHEKASNADREPRINTKQDAKHKPEYLGGLAVLRRSLRPTVNKSSIQEQSAESIDVSENSINYSSQPNIDLKSTDLRAPLNVRNGFNVQKRSLDYNAGHQAVFKGESVSIIRLKCNSHMYPVITPAPCNVNLKL